MENMENFIFLDGAEPQGSSNGFWYDVNNGYIKPEAILKHPEQLAKLKDALLVINQFEADMKQTGLIIEF